MIKSHKKKRIQKTSDIPMRLRDQRTWAVLINKYKAFSEQCNWVRCWRTANAFRRFNASLANVSSPFSSALAARLYLHTHHSQLQLLLNSGWKTKQEFPWKSHASTSNTCSNKSKVEIVDWPVLAALLGYIVLVLENSLRCHNLYKYLDILRQPVYNPKQAHNTNRLQYNKVI